MSMKAIAGGFGAPMASAAAVLMFAPSLTTVAHAQEAQASNTSGGVLEEITVSARKREESLLETPVSITAVTAESMEIKGIEDRRDLNRFTPGFKAAPQNTSAASRLINSYGMRGLGAVNLFWNGVPLNGGDIPELLDLQRVEVLKGPQTAYFGRSTFSGAINFLAQQAIDEPMSGYAEADLGQFDNKNFKAGVNGSIIPGVLAGRIAADYKLLGAQYDNFGYGGELGEQETTAVAGSLLYTPTEDLTVRVYYANWRADDGPNAISYLQSTDYNCNAGGAPAGTLNYFCGEIDRPRADRISQLPVFPSAAIDQLTGVTTTHTVDRDFLTHNGMKRRGQLAQAFVDYELPLDLTASMTVSWFDNEAAQIFDYANRFYPDPTTYNPSMTAYKFEDKYAEFRLATDQEARLRGLIGVSYVDSAQTIQSALSKSGVLSVSFVPTILYSETLGIFGSVSYDIIDSLTVTAEGRYQEDTVGRDTIGVSDLSGNTYSFVPRFTLDYEIANNINTFVSYSEGSRPGALNTGFLALPGYAQQQVLSQFNVPRVVPEEKLENWEVGLKGDFFDNTLRILANVYYAKWKERQIGATLFYTNLNGVLAQANITAGAGAVDAKGTEWEMVWAPFENFSVDATYAYNWTSIVRTTCTPCRLITGNLNPTGTNFARFPEQSASLGVNFRHFAFADFDAYYRIDANYQGKEYADETNVVWLAPYVQSNARVGLQNDRYKFEFYALNAFDNKVPQSIAQTQDQITGLNTLTTTPALKRTFGVRAGVKF
jgi:iron complex outermembrane receptor protein